ncbi:MAG: TenA family protein [Marinilabilia sp.]
MNRNSETDAFNLHIPPAGEWTARLWEHAGDIADGIIAHPFCRGLSNGTLPFTCFRHYLGQDLLYIEQDTRAFAITAGKSYNGEQLSFFLNMARDGLEIERLLQRDLLTRFKIERPAKMSPVCRNYTSFLLDQALNEPFEASAAALLPCFWIYHETGLQIRERATEPNPYLSWIQTYSGQEYYNYVRKFVAIAERLFLKTSLPLRKKMFEAYRQSARFEEALFSEAWQARKSKNH